MKRTLVFVLIGLLLAAGGAAQAKGKRSPKKLSLRFEGSILLGMEEARLRNIPIVLHLHSDT